MDPLVDEVELLQANPHYANVRYPDGRETTVSTKHLAPKGQLEVVDTLQAPERIPKETENVPLELTPERIPKETENLPPEPAPVQNVEPAPVQDAEPALVQNAEPAPAPAPVRRSQRVRRPVLRLDLKRTR